MLKGQGYNTAQFGKKYLGDRDEHPPKMHGFDEFFGNLYHLNAEEEPELRDYPPAEDFPAFLEKFGPRGVLHCHADGKGGQTIKNTGPLTKKRMETIDEEALALTVDFINRGRPGSNVAGKFVDTGEFAAKGANHFANANSLIRRPSTLFRPYWSYPRGSSMAGKPTIEQVDCAGGKSWVIERFENLHSHHAALKRARPSLAWTSTQLAQGRLSGSVASCRAGDIAVSCTSMIGSFEMRGPASTENLVLSLSLETRKPGMQWMRPAHVGMVGVFLPNTEVDSINRDQVSFAVIDIPRDALDRYAARRGITIDQKKLARSAVLPGQIAAAPRLWMSRLVAALHRGEALPLPPGYLVDEMIVEAAVGQLGRVPSDEDPMQLGGHYRIVARARAYIEAHLDAPIAIDDLVAAAFASRRTLYRAFSEVLDETPQSYILKLRLNRIRQDLAAPSEAIRTVTVVSNQWGIPELGRLAGRYREQFGELPRDTLARRSGTRALHAT